MAVHVPAEPYDFPFDGPTSSSCCAATVAANHAAAIGMIRH